MHTPLPAEVAREVVVWTRAQGLDPHLNYLERFIVRSDDPRADEYTTFMGARPRLEDDLVASIRHPVTKVMCAGQPPLPTVVAPLARALFAGRAEVMVSHPHFVEFVAPGVSKGRAVRWLARRLRVPLGAILAIGDQWNDIEMLAEVGHGAVMPTARPRSRRSPGTSRRHWQKKATARMIEALVLASPSAARAASVRLAEAAIEARSVAGRRRGGGPCVSARIVSRRCGRSGGGGRDPAVGGHRRATDRHGLRDRGLARPRPVASRACSR